MNLCGRLTFIFARKIPTCLISAGKDGQGRPTISARGCSANIDKVDVHIHGGASWFYRIFDHQIEKAIKKSVIKMVRFKSAARFI